MNPLLASMQAQFDALPAALLGGPALTAARQAALATALADGLPGPRIESWKYTPLRAFERRQFTVGNAPAAFDQAALASIPAPRMVFVNGRFDAQASQLDSLPAGIQLRPLSRALAEHDPCAIDLLATAAASPDAAFSRFNSALAADGVMLHAAAGCTLHAPLHLVFVGTPLAADSTWALASLITLEADADVSLVEHHLASAEHAHFSNIRTRVKLGERARLAHARIQGEAAAATQIARTDASLASCARYKRLDLELGAALSRHELNVMLAGEGAELDANGVLFADGRRHLDTRLDIRHLARNTRCAMNWRGLGADRGRAVFHGGIVIAAGADGSNAALSNKNLLLSEHAEIDTQPVLEIHADEVRAAHGATVGQLDPTALFYLRSRGLPIEQARQLLTLAFCREPLAVIEDSALGAWLAAQMDARLNIGDTP